MKDIGLVGMPGSGKSTVFAALTRHEAPAGHDHQAAVPVPEPRLEVLARLEGAARVVPAQARFVDVAGATTPRGLAVLREADALCAVVRAFGPGADPVGELAELTAELILADLGHVEHALEEARRRARGRSRDAGVAAEVAALDRAHEALAAEALLRQAGLKEAERAHLLSLSPLTLKPWVVVANLEEGTDLPPGLPDGTVGVWAEIEAETVGMPEDDVGALLAEFGVEEPGLARVVPACYRALDLITFFTTVHEEAHAWQLRRGATAPEAAGAIHTDMQRGFIRAEVAGYDDLVGAGGWEAARSRGLVRVEGKDYVVREGDVLHIRFAV